MLISVFGYGQAYEGTVQHDAKSQPPRQSTKACQMKETPLRIKEPVLKRKLPTIKWSAAAIKENRNPKQKLTLWIRPEKIIAQLFFNAKK